MTTESIDPTLIPWLPPSEVIAIEITKSTRLVLKIGTLEIDLDHNGRGTVKVDGQRLSVTAFRIDYRAGNLPRIELEIFPRKPGGDDAGRDRSDDHPEPVIGRTRPPGD